MKGVCNILEKKIQYHGVEERLSILEENKDLILIGEHNLTEGNFLIFSDVPPLPPRFFVTVPQEEFEAQKERLDGLDIENADLWYENVLLNTKLSSTEQEVADLWYQIVLGGM